MYEYAVQEDWYTESLSKLIPPMPLYDDNDCNDFFKKALKIYTHAYKTSFARTKSSKKDDPPPEEFSAWCDEAKEKLEQAKDGEIELEKFQKGSIG